MKIEITNRPVAAVARVDLAAGEKLTAEAGAMIAMSSDMSVTTNSQTRGGGILKGLKRMFAGENFFLNHFTANADDQHIYVGPHLAGDIIQHELDGTLIVQGGSWVASADGVDIDASWQGFKSLFSGESLFWVKCSGRGTVLVSSFGGIYEVDVQDSYVVDTGHIVAFEDSLEFRIGKASKSLIGSLLGGEGLVCKFSGRGRLWCQTHNPTSFGRKLGPLLRPR